MAAKDIKIVTDNLSCPVCYQLFKNPKYLPCHHSYCEQCLEKLRVQSKIICPECRKQATVPPGGVKDLDSNFFVNRFVDEFILKCEVEGEAEVKCDECSGEDPVVAFCPDCTFFLCFVCNEHHKRSNKSRDHGIFPLTELRPKNNVKIPVKPKPMICKEHDIELLFYCETCDQLVCMYCTVKDHNGHNHDTVKKIVGKHRQQLKKVTAPVEEMIKGLSDTNANIELMKKRIKQQGDEVNKKIDQHFDQVTQNLMKQKEQLKQQVHDTVSQKVKAVTIQLEEVKHTQEELVRMKELKVAVEKSSDQEVLSVQKQVIDRMQHITDKYKQINLSPVQQATMEFVPTQEAFPQFGSLCLTATTDAENYVLDIPKYCIKGKVAEFIVVTKDSNGDHCSKRSSRVGVQMGGVGGMAQVKGDKNGCYTVSFVPQKVGEARLSVFVNGQEIKGSPYSVMVKDYASVNKPTKTVNNDGNMCNPWGIACDKNGMWAVADNSRNCVYIFNSEDQLVRKLGTYGSDSGQFIHPAGVAFDNVDHLYVADYNNQRVQKFTTEGKYLLQFGNEDHKNGSLRSPRGLVVHNHKAYIADHVNKCISVFQTDGKFHHTIGSGLLGSPYDVKVSSNSQLLVTDYAHHCIYTFALDGNCVGKLGTGKGHSNNLCGVAVDHFGFVLVTNAHTHCVTIFDEDGTFINCFGSEGSAESEFQYPYGIAVSANGNIYVSDHLNRRILIFS